MELNVNEKRGSSIFMVITGAIGGVIGIWAVASFFSGLNSANWQFSEMIRQFLVATGNIREYETLVDYYTHIKGVEYLVAAAFFIAFPVYFKYLNKSYDKA